MRALRADSRIDDRPGLAELGITDPEHVARCATQWSADASYSWAVCEVTTGEVLAEVTLDPATGAIATRARADKPRPQPQAQSLSGDSPLKWFLRNRVDRLSAHRSRSNVRRRLSSQPPEQR